VRWDIRLSPAAARELRKLDPSVQRRVYASLSMLEVDPLPPGAKRLVGAEAVYRVRVGDYRVLYRVEEAIVVVIVVKIAHRREVYR
jgi:mRNA interferase RelE/StbE